MRFFRHNSFVLHLYVRIRRLFFSRKWINTIKSRQAISIFDYSESSKEIPKIFFDAYPENNLYGMSNSLFRYAQRELFASAFTDCYIEHGLFFGDYVARASYSYSDVRKVLTFGDYRETVLKKHPEIKKKKIKIIKIGPYIQYANSFLSYEQLKELKNRNGKTLLVFPSHSIPNETVAFDGKAFINEIEKVRLQLNMNKVLVCLYWRDIQDSNFFDLYKSRGYEIVSAGHRNDPFFLSRLRSIIELSDVTMSNEVGTNLGYCVFLNKPHYVYSQEISFKEGVDNIMRQENQSKAIFDSANEARLSVATIFNKIDATISLEQRKIVDYYWGLSYVLSPKEVRAIYSR